MVITALTLVPGRAHIHQDHRNGTEPPGPQRKPSFQAMEHFYRETLNFIPHQKEVVMCSFILLLLVKWMLCTECTLLNVRHV